MASSSTPRLLALPAELRESIYELVLTSSEPVSVSIHQNMQYAGLLLGNKEIREDTLGSYYKCNSFSLAVEGENISAARKFISTAAPHLRKIAFVRLSLATLPAFMSLELWRFHRVFENLRALEEAQESKKEEAAESSAEGKE